MRRTVACLVAAIVLVLNGPSIALAQGAKKLAVGSVARVVLNWPGYIAEQKGFFAQEGLNVEVTYTGSAAAAVQQLVGGAFDLVAPTTLDTSLRAIENGAEIAIIGAPITHYAASIVAAPNIRTLADLKGKRLILPFPKDMVTLIWNKWVAERGLQRGDIEQVYDGASPNRLAALVAGTVQAAFLTQPVDFQAADRGFAKFFDFGTQAKDYGASTILARSRWLRENGDTARAYLRAMAKAVDWLYDPAHRDEAIAILAKENNLDGSIASRSYDYLVNELKPFSRALAVAPTVLVNTVNLLVEVGDIKQMPADPAKKYTDPSYLPK